MNKLKYFIDFFPSYNDDFGYSGTWNQEVNKWLELLYKLNKNFYDKGKTKLATPKKRDEFLGEAKSIYYCHNYLNGTDFELEPVGKENKKLDFAYKENKEKIFVEVKTPSWRGEVFKDTNLTHGQKKDRLKKPQYISGEDRSFSPKDAIIDSIKNSLPKFEKNQKNILMITPNMFVEALVWPSNILDQFIKDELNKQDTQNLISGVAILETRLSMGNKNIDYQYYYFDRKKI